MKSLSIAGALALSLLVAACGGDETIVQDAQNQTGVRTIANSAQTIHTASGNVTAIAGDRVTISHGPVESLGWPAMTMTFRVGEPAMLRGIAVGDPVDFQFRQSGSDYSLTAISKAQ